MKKQLFFSRVPGTNSPEIITQTNRSLSTSLALKLCFIVIAGLLSIASANAQFAATWALTANKNNTGLTGAQAASVTAGVMVPGINFPNPGAHNTDGYKCQIPSGSWPAAATDGDNIDFSIFPATGFDLTLGSITFSAKTSGGSGNSMLSLSYQVDGAGPWIAFGSPQVAASGGTSSISFAGLNTMLFDGHTYEIRVYVYGTGTQTSSRSVSIKNFVINGTAALAGTPPTITTDSARATGKYTGIGYGTITAGTLAITSSGVCWGLSANPLVTDPFVNPGGPLTSGIIGNGTGGNITGLTAGTTYHVRTYATTLAGTIYGADLTFTTDPPSEPSLTTRDPQGYPILSMAATSGGIFTDSGGVAITQKGVCWSTSTVPTLQNSFTSDGQFATDYTSALTGLLPNTVYYVRAYAINSVDTGYGNIISFTTGAPQPTLFPSVPNLSFPATQIGGSTVLSYTLTGSTLTANGSPATVTAPEGFQVSTSPNSGFASSIDIPYTGSDLSVTIYVSFLPAAFTSYSGTVTHSGGGATGLYVQNITVSGSGALPAPPTVSNMGNDFWVGYGFQSNMTDNNDQEMIFYLSSNVSDSIIVEIPGLGFREAYWLDANVARETNFMPKGGGMDARLNSTGVSAKAIHVYSKTGKTFALYAHIFAAQSSGATLVLPTNTWGSQYTALTTGGSSNSDYPHSYFFVIAKEDNTQIEIVPSADITATATGTTTLYPANVPFTITLNKGEVFNALGTLFAKRNGNDLTGSTVKSLDCNKKISLFTGNGRVQLRVNGCSYTNGGSDNFLQQMFPKVSWGTKYLTTPLKDMEAGFFRVCVQDPATEVKVNGNVIDPAYLVNQFFYEIPTDTALLIESNKPVMVAQFCASHLCTPTGLPYYPSTGNYGDPEMIIISPVNQAVKEVTVYSATRYAIVRNYINVIVKKEGVSSFKLDGVDVSAQFAVHPQDSAYYFASFSELAGGISHSLSSTETFNAIAYGFTTNSNHESYGYNAGTAVNDLTTPLIIENPYGGPSQVQKTCRGNNVKFSAVLPYETNKITYSFGNSPIVPNSDTTIESTSGNIPHDSTFVVNGITYYVYRLSTPYSYSAIGNYTVQITSFVPTSTDECFGGSDRTINYAVEVIEGVTADFLIDYNSCANDTVKLTDQSSGLGYDITKWKWSYNGGTTPLPSGLDSVQNPILSNPADNSDSTYTLIAINSLGCYSDTTKAVPVAAIPNVTFSPLTPVCTSNPSFALTGGLPATVSGVGTGVYSGPGVSNGNFDAATAGAGTHTLIYTYTTVAGCSDTAQQTIVVSLATTLTITPVGQLCLDAGPVTLVPSVAGGVFTGPGVSGNTFTPSVAGVGTATIGYSIPSNTCSVAATTQIVVNPLPIVPTDFSAGADVDAVFGHTATLTGTGSASNTYLWSPNSVVNQTSLVTNSTATQSTTYTLTATNSLGCKATDVMELTLTKLCVDPPSVFTPNGDGYYDKWVVINGTCTKEVKVNVYNRWGGLVYSNAHYNNEWDGTHNGAALPDGTYYYIVEVFLTDGSTSHFRGNITIMR